MPCREGPVDPEWLALTSGERAAVFFFAALLADDSLDRRFYLSDALAYASGTYEKGVLNRYARDSK
jgi:hypothetical protein